MPRGFLVKRYGGPRPAPPPAHQPFALPERVRRYSDEDRSDLSSCDDLHETGVAYSELDSHQKAPLALTRKPFVSHSVLYLTSELPSVRLPSGTPPPLVSVTPTRPDKIPALAVVSPDILHLGSGCPPKKRPRIEEPPPPPSPKKKCSKGKPKVSRKLTFDEDKTSPVSGTFIRDLDSDDEVMPIRSGDIDPSLNVVVVTEEARAELAKIENRIGDYVCQLCRESFEDAFGLAQHRCSRIVHVEYRCPDCDKVFNCPANLASHRRWHKPRAPPKTLDGNEGSTRTPSPPDDLLHHAEDGLYDCEVCGKRFKRQAYLRKHLQVHSSPREPSPQPPPLIDVSTLQRHPPPSDDFSAFAGLMDCRCAVCESLFPNRPALEKHLRSHASEVYPCKYCSCTFFSSPGLSRHVSKYHPTPDIRPVMQLLSLPPTVKAS